MPAPLTLDGRGVVLPKGTRVVLRCDIAGDDGYVHRRASLAVVAAHAYNTYALQTPSGRRLTAQRDQLTVQKQEVLDELGVKQWDFARLERTAIYAATVGSRAWGLDGPDSDEDIRGVFLAPFDDVSGLWTVPGEIHDPAHTRAYWEVARAVQQGLKGDANTLETLWSPLHRLQTPLGAVLVDQRDMFVSMNVLGSFGRYAQSQFKKIERTLERQAAQVALVDAVRRGRIPDRAAAVAWLVARVPGKVDGAEALRAMIRSLSDRGVLAGPDFASFQAAVAEGRAGALQPPPYRPKNAYNLLRLLYSCRRWLTAAEPLIRVEGATRDVLMAVKTQTQPIETTLQMAKTLAAEVEEAAHGARLPKAPDYARADAFLRRCRRAAARRVFGASEGAPSDEASAAFSADSAWTIHDEWTPRLLPTSLPDDVDQPALNAFLQDRLHKARAADREPLWVALTGAHAYGFESPDSDLDLKGVHAVPAARVLSGAASEATDAYLDVWRGRELDYTTNELGPFSRRLLVGNGNALEQLLGPYVVLATEGGHALVAWARANLSRRSIDHYRGFLKGIRREYGKEAQAGQRKAKRLLYGYRVALTGLHLMRHGEIEMNVARLADGEWPRVAELIRIKSEAEFQALPEEVDDAPYLADLDRLDAQLLASVEQSVLPEAPSDFEGLGRILVALRR